MKKKLFSNKFRNNGILVLFVFSCTFGLIVQSCSSNDVSDQITESNFTNKVCNFENPYEYAGKYSSEGLKFVLNNVQRIRLKSSNVDIKKEIYDQTVNFFENNPLGKDTISSELFESSIQPINNILLKSGKSQFSEIQQKYLDKFQEIIMNPKGCNSTSDVINKIKFVEEEINNSDMSNSDKEILLVTYAVGRNNLEYWLSTIKTTPAPRLKGGNTENQGFLGWWSSNVTPVVTTALNGAIAGAATGAVTGAIYGGGAGTIVAPGPGTITVGVTGAVTGAVIGAIGGAIWNTGVYVYDKATKK